MKRIVGIGASVIDTLISCKTYVQEDTKQAAYRVVKTGGGPVGNALAVIAKLGVKAEILGAFADDEGGDYLISDYRKIGVTTEHVVRIKQARSFYSYILLADDTKTRTCVYDRGTVPDDPSDIHMETVCGADILHLDGNYIKSACAAAKLAKENGVKVSLDAGGLYDGIEELLPYVDILIPSQEFACGFTGYADVHKAMLCLQERYLPEVLVITCGARGGCYMQDGEVMDYQGICVPVRDTNGAGDTFHGAFLVRYLESHSVAESCRFASAVAALKCSQEGVREADLSAEQAETLYRIHR